MSNDPFDLERVRRRWANAAKARPPATPKVASPALLEGASPPAAHALPTGPSPPATHAPPRGAPDAKGARPPSPVTLDPFQRARGDLAELRQALTTDLGREGRTAVEPFLRRVEQAVAQLESAPTQDPPADPKALRAELEDALFDLEDLLEVFTIIPK